MTVYSIWPAFACLSVLMVLTCLPGFNGVGLTSATPHVKAIDGARGFLALGVALHHCIIYYHFVRTGVWQVPPSRFYTLAGQASVGCFFIITGYLFWSKLLRAKGHLDFPTLIRSRFFRLAPVYCVAASMAIIIIFIQSGSRLNVPMPQYLLQIAQNMAAGILPFINMNGYSKSTTVLAGVTWTLQYEWQFYLALPAMAIFARYSRFHLPFTAGLLVASALVIMCGSSRAIFYAFFAIGMLGASLQADGHLIKLPKTLLSVLCTGCLVVVPLLSGTAYRLDIALLLGLVFYCVVSGADLFGLLTARPSIKLGEISYGIYMMQGIILYLAFAIQPVRAFALASDFNFWIIILAVLISLTFSGLILHLFVERPAMRFNKRLSERTAGPTSNGFDGDPQTSSKIA